MHEIPEKYRSSHLLSQVFEYFFSGSEEVSSRTKIRKDVGGSVSKAALENLSNTPSVVDVDGKTLMETDKPTREANRVTMEPS